MCQDQPLLRELDTFFHEEQGKDGNSKPYCFIIPEYQRGYRWEEKQIYDLLNDIDAFKINEKGVRTKSWTTQALDFVYTPMGYAHQETP